MNHPMSLRNDPPGELRRLSAGWYQGKTWVHWTMTIDRRERGWLTSSHHAEFREVLLHTCARNLVFCPSYCLMPDHAHILLMGLCSASDQRLAVRFLRKAWGGRLKSLGRRLQKQAYDHVLNENERNPDAFENTLVYIFKNPERAGFVEDWKEWPYLGSMAAGYPDFDPREGLGAFNKRMWTLYNKETTRMSD